MSLKFNEAFDKLMEKIPQFDSPTPTIISKDTEEIVQKIVQAFHDINSIFQGTLIDFIKTSINHPYHYPVLFLKMPFNINRIKVLQDKDASVYDLKADVQHPVVRSGYVIPYLIISLFNDDLKRALARIGQMNCASSKTYTLSVFMAENSAKGMPVFEIKTTGIECEVTLCKFSLKFQFLNDSITYFATGPHFWALDQTTLENSNAAIIKIYEYIDTCS
ncbi:uncharacterized protein LOC111076745 [Drosophila obscura]|uniref:uncharacterized protein LOC111076745 n=1 Tax=Drosophila obscura TaxID=7282 RepID=UPI001BB2972B|nr:uncharacterized protein LOC111076745 [Drosophila obscura]